MSIVPLDAGVNNVIISIGAPTCKEFLAKSSKSSLGCQLFNVAWKLSRQLVCASVDYCLISLSSIFLLTSSWVCHKLQFLSKRYIWNHCLLEDNVIVIPLMELGQMVKLIFYIFVLTYLAQYKWNVPCDCKPKLMIKRKYPSKCNWKQLAKRVCHCRLE